MAKKPEKKAAKKAAKKAHKRAVKKAQSDSVLAAAYTQEQETVSSDLVEPKGVVSKEQDASIPTVTIPLESAERFFATFEKSAKRWEMIVYPGMFIVVMFMAYGFYLIYNITNDMRQMVTRFDDPEITKNMTQLSQTLGALNSNIGLMARRVKTMSDDTKIMSKNTTAMSKSTAQMSKSMEAVKYMKSMDTELKKMNQSVYVMNKTVRTMGGDMSNMRRDFTSMNRSVTKPLNMMNSFMPF